MVSKPVSLVGVLPLTVVDGQQDTPKRDGEWHDHHGLKISNGEGTVSVYKDEDWETKSNKWDGEMLHDPFR